MIWGNAHGVLNENKQDTVIWKKQLKWWKWLSPAGGIMAFYIFFFMLFPSFLQRECIPFVLYYEKAMRKEQKYVKNRLQHMLNDTREMQSPLSKSGKLYRTNHPVLQQNTARGEKERVPREEKKC